MSLYLGVDIGGTFTDLAVMSEDGSVETTKAPTTPGRLDEGVFAALERYAETSGTTLPELLGRVASFSHGTTQATNALIERKGARTGLITTRGFGDTLFVQRLLGMTAGMPSGGLGWYSRRRYPDPIVPRRLVREVPERVDQSGAVLLDLDEDAVRRAVDELIEEGVDAFAVCLLWSFRNPAHEQRIGEIIREAGGDRFVTLSSDLSPVIGEYERTATTALNSYLAPIVIGYLERLEGRLRENGFEGVFTVLNSIGGVMSAKDAARRAVLLLASGPTGGVIGSNHVAQELGHENVITTDMGGTSFDVGLIVDGRPVVAPVTEVAKYHVTPPMIDITAIGAGGGSIATVEDGLLRVGPESAGADPGPVAYGRGGDRVTVTDADIVLGILDPAHFLGGRMPLDRDKAARAIEEQIAGPLGLSVDEAAAGIRRVVDEQMADTLRELTVGRGHDPRDFVLYAYGGAGPAHCASYGAELGVREIVVAATSMVQSAFGALASDIHHAAERSLLLSGGGGPTDPWTGIEPDVLAGEFAALEERCRAALEADGVAPEQTAFARSVDIRYRSQTHSLIIPCGDDVGTQEGVIDLVNRFERTYEATYGQGAGFREAGIEVTTFRVEGTGATAKPSLARLAPSTNGGPVAVASRSVYDAGRQERIDAPVYEWSALTPGATIAGPTVLEHPETTVFVGADQRVEMDSHGNLIIREGRRS
ncbi:MAG: N-methylhydantoinase [Thermoleophilaceae bacterium]|nr:N-methylhydantoinase [Thermoleophilaceae bacterium]